MPGGGVVCVCVGGGGGGGGVSGGGPGGGGKDRMLGWKIRMWRLVQTAGRRSGRGR
jgi:hypothetical protein